MKVKDILHDLRSLRVLVVGDICLDRWCTYDPALAEASRETGIPRTAVVRTENTPGAGGTIANNVVALGVEDVSVLGVVGDDGFGFELQRALKKRSIATSLLVCSREVCTFTYTKLLNEQSGEEDQPRVDFINRDPLPPKCEAAVLAALSENFRNFDVVIVSDQAETEDGGAVTASVRDRIIELADTYRDRIVWVDSRRRPELFRRVILKPNRDEAVAACERAFGSADFPRLRSDNELRALYVTHGGDGVRVFDTEGEQWVPARPVTPVDICGAGDSFSAGAACALAAGANSLESAQFGNLVASITVTKKGTGTASPAELINGARSYGAWS